MSSSFGKCPACGRLNIYGAECVCVEKPRRDCDCTYSGNTQHIGPNCKQRIRDVWSAVLNGTTTLSEDA